MSLHRRHILHRNLLVCLCVPESHYFNLNLVSIMKSFEGRLALQNKKWLNKRRSICQKALTVRGNKCFCHLSQCTYTKKSGRRFNYWLRCKDKFHCCAHFHLTKNCFPRNVSLEHVSATYPRDISLQDNPEKYPWDTSLLITLGQITATNPWDQHIPGIYRFPCNISPGVIPTT